MITYNPKIIISILLNSYCCDAYFQCIFTATDYMLLLLCIKTFFQLQSQIITQTFIETAFKNFLNAKSLSFILFDVAMGCNALQYVATVTKVTEPYLSFEVKKHNQFAICIYGDSALILKNF